LITLRSLDSLNIPTIGMMKAHDNTSTLLKPPFVYCFQSPVNPDCVTHKKLDILTALLINWLYFAIKVFNSSYENVIFENVETRKAKFILQFPVRYKKCSIFINVLCMTNLVWRIHS
jgi:hypothetical protein